MFLVVPTLFSIFLAAMHEYVIERLVPSVLISYCTEGKLFNLSHLRAKTKVTITSIAEFQCAELQHIVDIFSEAYNRFGLPIYCQKT